MSLGSLDTAWFPCRTRVPQAAFRLFLFHHAGGMASTYARWMPLFPEDWEVLAVELPGRGAQSGRPPICSMPALIDAILPVLQPLCRVKFGLFGHSMGALVAFELARRIESCHPGKLTWLGVSGRSAPRSSTRGDLRVSGMPYHGIVSYLARLGGTPREILEDRELMNEIVRVFRADMSLVESYAPAEGACGVPITALGGLHDPHVPPAGVTLWEQETTAGFEYALFPGGHFFLHENCAQVISRIITRVRTALS